MSEGSRLVCQVKPLKAEVGAARSLLSLGNNERIAVSCSLASRMGFHASAQLSWNPGVGTVVYHVGF